MGAVGVNIQLMFCIHSYVSNFNTERYCSNLNFQKRDRQCACFLKDSYRIFSSDIKFNRKLRAYFAYTSQPKVSLVYRPYIRVKDSFFIVALDRTIQLECVGHSFAFVGHFVFLRDAWIRTQRAAVGSRRAINLATHLKPTQPPIYTNLSIHLAQLSHPSPPTYPSISPNLATHLHQLSHPSPPTFSHPSPINLATHLHQPSHPSPPTQPPISTNLATRLHQPSHPSPVNLATHLHQKQMSHQHLLSASSYLSFFKSLNISSLLAKISYTPDVVSDNVFVFIVKPLYTIVYIK